MELLTNPIRGYAWGSHTAIAVMQGRAAPTDQPEAELWIGAHPAAPSRLPDGTTLDAAVAADPAGRLGSRVGERFGERLPFMVKLLAAKESLSLQAHPDAARAAAGFAAGTAGYADPYAKPELLVALTDFDALCGFRHPIAAAQAYEALSIPALAPVIDTLNGDDTGRALHDAVEALLCWPEPERAGLVEAAVAAVARDDAPAYLLELAERYPADMGVLVTLLLNHVSLAPGDAISMPAGNLHAYLRGTGVEVLGTSDNVLRGGLTPKPVHVGELLRVLRYEVLAEPVAKPAMVAPGVVTWTTPAPEFRLVRVSLSGGAVDIDIDGPCIALVTEGRVRVDDLELGPAQAGFGRSAERLAVSGDGVVFVATAGL